MDEPKATDFPGRRKEIFSWLCDLRDDGSINMFAAAPVIADTFPVTLREAREYLKLWIEEGGPRE